MSAPAPAPGLPLDPDRNLALELVRATEAAAMAAARQVGHGDKTGVDQAAVDAMRPVLGSVGMRGVVVIGEGEKDEAPMLYNGEHVGNGSDPEVDIAVDPVDGTTAAAKGLPDAVAVVGLAERGTMFDPGPCVYMDKLVVPAAAAAAVDPTAPVAELLDTVARALGSRREEMTVAVLDRPRHQALVEEIRAAGAAVRFLLDGDVAGAIAVGRGSGVDVLMGIGGTPEAVLAACALRCNGAAMFGRLHPRDDAERRAALEFGHDLDRILTTEDLVRGDDVFFAATGVTDGTLLRGVRFEPETVVTHSLSMRSRSGAVRVIETRHDRAQSNLIDAHEHTIHRGPKTPDRKAS
ncbi:class II fructose-bisphosphatase [Nocardioides marmoribigeumensis]|uniref:Fructose-1,6-bisphosphatase n=1 Tax=Nocardioides marmoribigeumensis TaxID=433649 RepID=A0ABU2BS95_9ACTN|nr:class II fructose-bisphosphatase [Nocardioides marmoribigeumensis]MDR7361509.1 fructose-1,6-bisphosphatase II [Nocardioides marmoribigeumensis]